MSLMADAAKEEPPAFAAREPLRAEGRERAERERRQEDEVIGHRDVEERERRERIRHERGAGAEEDSHDEERQEGPPPAVAAGREADGRERQEQRPRVRAGRPGVRTVPPAGAEWRVGERHDVHGDAAGAVGQRRRLRDVGEELGAHRVLVRPRHDLGEREELHRGQTERERAGEERERERTCAASFPRSPELEEEPDAAARDREEERLRVSAGDDQHERGDRDGDGAPVRVARETRQPEQQEGARRRRCRPSSRARTPRSRRTPRPGRRRARRRRGIRARARTGTPRAEPAGDARSSGRSRPPRGGGAGRSP